MLLSIEAQLCTRRECKTFRLCTLCIATDEGLRGRNVLHSLCVHGCASMHNNICSEPMNAARNEIVFYCRFSICSECAECMHFEV